MNTTKIREFLKFFFGYTITYIFWILGHSTSQIGIWTLDKTLKMQTRFLFLPQVLQFLELQTANFKKLKKILIPWQLTFFCAPI